MMMMMMIIDFSILKGVEGERGVVVTVIST